MSQPKERRHDTHEYFIILILVDLLLHLNYSLPLVLWHDILLLLFLPSQFPLLILLPLPGLSPKCHALSSSMSLGHVRDFWGPRDEPCVLINPKGMFTAPISSLSSGLLNPTASLPSLLELTEMKPLPPRGIRAQNRNTGTETEGFACASGTRTDSTGCFRSAFSNSLISLTLPTHWPTPVSH